MKISSSGTVEIEHFYFILICFDLVWQIFRGKCHMGKVKLAVESKALQNWKIFINSYQNDYTIK